MLASPPQKKRERSGSIIGRGGARQQKNDSAGSVNVDSGAVGSAMVLTEEMPIVLPVSRGAPAGAAYVAVSGLPVF